ncbi:MAG: PAS domain S-box protein, partial [Candidatus Sericytochromatia bacterium]
MSPEWLQNLESSGEFQPEHSLELLQRRDQFLAMLAVVASRLNAAADWEQALRQVLPVLGQTPDVDRIAINEVFCEQEQWFFSQRWVWLRQDNQVHPGAAELQRVSYARFAPQWLDMLRQDQVIKGSLASFPEAERAFMQETDSRSVLTVPIQADQQLWGSLALVNTQTERQWSEPEIAIFKTVALNLGSALSRFQKVQLLHERSYQLEARVKEIQCLYEISRWADVPDLSLPELYQKIVELAPAAFQWPEQTGACLEVEGQRYCSAAYAQTETCLASELRFEDRVLGRLQVCLQPPLPGLNPFLDEEQIFLDEVNRIIVRIIDRVNARESLIRLNAELEERVGLRVREIAEREALLGSLINSLPDLIYYKDPEGRYLGCNRAYEEFTGKRESELLGLRDAELFTENHLREEWTRNEWSREEALLMLQDWIRVFTVLDRPLVPGEVSSSESWLYSHQGPRVYLETRKTPYCGSDGQVIGVVGVSRDLTQRKLAENAMVENEVKIRQLVEGVPVGIFVMEASGKSYFANQAAIDLLGQGILPAGDAAQQLEGYK